MELESITIDQLKYGFKVVISCAIIFLIEQF